jgi:serine/threonine protein kinase
MKECSHCGHENSLGSQFCAQCGAGFEVQAEDPQAAYSTPVAPGTIFDAKYQVLQEIGRGGMGVVYRGHDLSLGRMVAIKVLPEQFNTDDEVIARFKKEARAMAALDHPNVVPVYAIGQQRSFHYFVMKFLEGSTVAELLDAMRLRDPNGVRFHPRQVHNILLQGCRGLGHAHKRGLIHRDIKPGNLMVSSDNHVTIMDFGIVKEQVAPEGEALTRTGMVFGTPEYMAPEQAQGKALPGPTADLYSLGVVAYEMLTGEPPFKGDTPFSVVLQHIKEPPATLMGRGINVTAEFEAVIFRALEKRTELRYPNAEAMAAALVDMDAIERHTSMPPAIAPYVNISPPRIRPTSGELPPTVARPRSTDLPPLGGLGPVALTPQLAPPAALFDRPAGYVRTSSEPPPVVLANPQPRERDGRVITISDQPVPDFDLGGEQLTPFVNPGTKPFDRPSADQRPVTDERPAYDAGEFEAAAYGAIRPELDGDLFEGPVARAASNMSRGLGGVGPSPMRARASADILPPPSVLESFSGPQLTPPSGPASLSQIQSAEPGTPPPSVRASSPPPTADGDPGETTPDLRVATPSRPLPHIPVAIGSYQRAELDAQNDPAVLEDRPGHYRHLVTAQNRKFAEERNRKRTMLMVLAGLAVVAALSAFFLFR